MRGLPATLATLLFVSPLAAQAPLPPTSPRFAEIVRLAQVGYGDSARAVMARVMVQTRPDDPTYPEALYTAAAVAKTLAESRLYFARIAVDFADSPWADKAILRLAQLDYGSGNSESAVIRVRRLFTNYPDSPVLPVAALFGARAAFERRDGRLACDWISSGLRLVGDDLELKNQLEYARQRCTPEEMARLAALPKADTTKRPAATVMPPAATVPPPRAAPTTKSTASPWRVQVTAITDAKAARRVEQQLERAGFTVYRVAGARGLVKLQAGPFATREAAVAAVPRLKSLLRGTPFVTKAP